MEFNKGDIVATRTGTQYRVGSIGDFGSGRTVEAFRLSNGLVTYFRAESLTLVEAAEVEDQGYSEWIDLIESQVYVNAEARVHRDFSSQSGVQGFVGVRKTPEQEDVRECAGCEDSENAPHASDCQHDSIYTIMSEWYMLDGIKKRHVMCGRCGDNLPDEYYV